MVSRMTPDMQGIVSFIFRDHPHVMVVARGLSTTSYEKKTDSPNEDIMSRYIESLGNVSQMAIVNAR